MILGLISTSLAQVPFAKSSMDENITQSKQYKRQVDFASRRTGHENINPEWLKWQAWKKVRQSKNHRKNLAEWQNFGPDTVSGRMISIAFHPIDTNTFLVGSASGGLWRTTDYGQNWEPLTDEYFTMGVGAVAYNPKNPNSILIATGEGYGFGSEFTNGYGVLISHDGGNTWNTTILSATIDQYFAGMDVYWNPLDTNKIVVACSFGMYYSDDGGSTFAFTLDRIGGRMVPDPFDPDRIYFTARYYTATYPGGLYVSTDAGASWSLTGSGLPAPADFGYASIAVHPIYNNVIFVSVSNSTALGSGPLLGLYKSSDFGNTFTQVASTTDYFCYPPPYSHFCLGWYANTIVMSPADTNHLIAGGPRLWSSLDGGVTWNTIDVNPAGTDYAVHADHHQTVFHPYTGDLFDINDGGVNYSADYGANWTSISEGLITHQFYSIAFAQTDPDVVIGGTQDVGTFSTTTAHSGGWNNDFSGDSFDHLIDHTNENIWYGTGYINLQRVKTTNSGGSWFTINSGTSGVDQWRMPMEMHPNNSSTLLSANDDFIYKSTNAGNTWSTVSGFGSIGNFAYDQVDPDLVYASQLFGPDLYRSTDGGNNWVAIASPTTEAITDLSTDPSNYGTVYMSVGSFSANNQLYVSYDSGGSWSNITNNLPQVPTHSVEVSTYNFEEIYVGNELGVWVSTDRSSTWNDYNDGLPAAVVVEDLHFYAPDSTIRIGTYGRGYWRSKAVNQPVTLSEHVLSGLVVFPNPSPATFNLSFTTEFSIFDPSGRLINTGNGNLVNLQNHPPGVYFLKAGSQFVKLLVE